MTVDMGIRAMVIRQRNEAFNRSGQKGIPFKLIKKAKGHLLTYFGGIFHGYYHFPFYSFSECLSLYFP